jgi:hypothetical protein
MAVARSVGVQERPEGVGYDGPGDGGCTAGQPLHGLVTLRLRPGALLLDLRLGAIRQSKRFPTLSTLCDSNLR